MCVCVCVCACVRVYVCVYLCVYVHMHKCVHVCIHITRSQFVLIRRFLHKDSSNIMQQNSHIYLSINSSRIVRLKEISSCHFFQYGTTENINLGGGSCSFSCSVVEWTIDRE